MKRIGISVGVLVSVVGVAIAAYQPVAATPKPSVCDPRTKQFKATPLRTADDKNRATRALDHLRAMMQPLRQAGDGSTITVQAAYGYDYTGELKGSFQLSQHAAKPAYSDLSIESYAFTDTLYLTGRQPATASQTFRFPNSKKGHKLLRLVNTRTGKVLAEYFEPTLSGLIRSYEFSPGQDGYDTRRAHYSFTYDQALALLVAIGADDKAMADKLAAGLISIQVTSGQSQGAFPSSAHQLNPQLVQPRYYTGGIAFALYALIRYQERYGNINNVNQAIQRAFQWVQSKKTTTGPGAGLYRGGTNLRDDDAAKPFEITWHSTEHNTDLWHVFERAARVFKNDSYRQEADALAKAITEKLWNTAEHRFDQGLGDHNKALDTASWGSIFLQATGQYDKAEAALAYSRHFTLSRGSTKGFTPYLTGTYTPTVWLEGTFGVTHAYNIAGQKKQAQATVQDAAPAQNSHGAWLYVTDVDTANQMTNAYSVASTAWYLLATAYPDAIWSECRTDERPAAPPSRQLGNTLSSSLAGDELPSWLFLLIALVSIISGSIVYRSRDRLSRTKSRKVGLQPRE